MTAFAVTGTVLLAAIFAGAVLAGARPVWIFGALPAAVLLPGLFWRTWGELEISVWNKAVRITARILCAYVLKVAYFTLVWPLSLAGSSLQTSYREREKSRWIVRQTDVQPCRQWMVCLLPVVWLLAVFRDEYQENAPPASTYTLY